MEPTFLCGERLCMHLGLTTWSANKLVGQVQPAPSSTRTNATIQRTLRDQKLGLCASQRWQKWFPSRSKAESIRSVKSNPVCLFPITVEKLGMWKSHPRSHSTPEEHTMGPISLALFPFQRPTTCPNPGLTIVLIHGRPYIIGFCLLSICHSLDWDWLSWVASAGHAVLCVNYRSGRSPSEAHAGLRAAAGTADYSDMIDWVKDGVGNGAIDRDRVGIAGWSYGDYLSAWDFRNNISHYVVLALIT